MDILGRLIELQTAADAEHAKLTSLDGPEHAAQRQSWFTAAATIQAAITEHAQENGLNRFDLEAAVKKAARHPSDDG
ncbi:hypothetical protein [Streptomyces iranensis]|uniref:Antibiotic biosynthesis monooxygenase (ABM) superfamily enzyme n=1 Tax=Streptomyces iranensis TaxID=576784 RepID=A0ABS4MUW5_9ACTN|nr:hypothetical protein [Streptomyces iranensis]MBP2063004.1 antibiotic biosynthesis monooxygenase (ABM) superfamily enzyme [Streptomyces iranensis]